MQADELIYNSIYQFACICEADFTLHCMDVLFFLTNTLLEQKINRPLTIKIICVISMYLAIIAT